MIFIKGEGLVEVIKRAKILEMEKGVAGFTRLKGCRGDSEEGVWGVGGEIKDIWSRWSISMV